MIFINNILLVLGLALMFLGMLKVDGGWELRVGALISGFTIPLNAVVDGAWPWWSILLYLVGLPFMLAVVVFPIVSLIFWGSWKVASKGTEDEGEPVPISASFVDILRFIFIGVRRHG